MILESIHMIMRQIHLKHKYMTEEDQKDTLKPGDSTTTKSSKDFPLLLKNYDDLMVRSSHWTPLTNGSTPLGRPLKEYMRFSHLFLFISQRYQSFLILHFIILDME